MGTVAYMSPEQVRGEVLDARTDLFSLGIVLYEMATGRQAFSGTTTGVVFDGILNRDPTPASESNPGVPQELERIVGKALEKDKDVRYQTARDLEADLKRLRRDTTSGRKAVTTSSVGASPSSGATATAAAPMQKIHPALFRGCRDTMSEPVIPHIREKTPMSTSSKMFESNRAP